ncbi:hypothetical protein BGW39_006595 [Mortierella sp. 14UC]|nr:hypothetical protein BGW39_006595 [Mortierella sp. 14UC]
MPGTSPSRRSRALFRSLIARTPAVHPPRVVLILGLDVHTNTTYYASSSLFCPTRLNRLALVRHLNIDTSAFLERSALSATEPEYIHGQDFLEMYRIDRKDTTCRRESESNQLTRYYPNVLYREVTWTLAKPILNQLESLTFPLSDIRRYLQVIDRLRRLEHVHVRIDMVLYCICCTGPNDDEPRRKRIREELQQLVWFVKEHI